MGRWWGPVVLWAGDGLVVRASRTAGLGLRIEGQHLWHGADGQLLEYEYVLTVPRGDVRRVVEALGGRRGANVLTLLRARGEEVVGQGEQRWLLGIGVRPAFWSHGG